MSKGASSSGIHVTSAALPKAAVFGSGYLQIPAMAKSGFVLNNTGIFLVNLFSLPASRETDLTSVSDLLR
ncbi:MAG: hypothetical protein WB502_14010 [Thermoactinomyces sp.]